MSELTPQARALLDSVAGSDEPTAADEARARGRLEAAVGVTLPVATVVVASHVAAAGAGTALGAASTGASKLALIIAGVTALGVGSATTVVVMKQLAPAPPRAATVPLPKAAPIARATQAADAVPTAPARPQPVLEAVFPAAGGPLEIAPVPVEPPRPEKRVALAPPVRAEPEPAPVPAAPAVSEPSAPPLAAADPEDDVPVPGSCGEATQARHSQNANAALVAQKPKVALAWLDAFQRACPTGTWDSRAWVLRMMALCRLGRTNEARGFVAWFRTEHSEDTALLRTLAADCPANVLSNADAAAE